MNCMSVVRVFVHTFKCLMIFVAYFCFWFHFSFSGRFKLLAGCHTPLQPHNQMSIRFSDSQAKSAVFLTLDFADEVFLFVGSIHGTWWSRALVQIHLHFRQEWGWGAGCQWWRQLATLHRSAGQEHDCAAGTVHQQRAELPPKARQLRQPESGGDSTLSVLLKLKEIDCIREVGGRSDYRI